MSKISKEYIKEIKAMFPIRGKSEKKYFKELFTNIEDFAAEENVKNKKELYQNFGKPIDIVAEYFSHIDTTYIIKKLRYNKFIKTLIAVIIAILLVISTMFCVIRYQAHQTMLLEEEVITVEEVLE